MKENIVTYDRICFGDFQLHFTCQFLCLYKPIGTHSIFLDIHDATKNLSDSFVPLVHKLLLKCYFSSVNRSVASTGQYLMLISVQYKHCNTIPNTLEYIYPKDSHRIYQLFSYFEFKWYRSPHRSTYLIVWNTFWREVAEIPTVISPKTTRSNTL